MARRYTADTPGSVQSARRTPTWTLVVACNNEIVLRNTLLSSPAIDASCQVIVERDSSCAARAYNRGIEKAKADVVVFAHQDVYLPSGWIQNVFQSIERVERAGYTWGVLGVFGVPNESPSLPGGFCYSTGLQKLLGAPFVAPMPARTLDELVLIVRRSSGLRFDVQLPGFHLYGTDICLQATTAGLKNFIVPAFCIHNTNGISRLPASFWQAYFYLQRKWKKDLPVATCCTKITRLAWPVGKRIIAEWKDAILQRQVGRRLDHIATFYGQLLQRHPEVGAPVSFPSRRMKIGLLGATLETPNLGVSALATGAVRCMLSAYPDAEVFLLDYGRESSIRKVTVEEKAVEIPLANMRFSKKFWLSNNITTLLSWAAVYRSCHSSAIRQWILCKSWCLREIASADLFGAVAGGDSFSDIYGRARFLYVALPQILILLMKKRLVLMPQTYGPFRHKWTRLVARWIVAHAERAWSRDEDSLVKLMVGKTALMSSNREFCFDLAFGIESHAPKHVEVEGICLQDVAKNNLVGLNISGLLYQNGYSGNNEFKIHSNYREFVREAVRLLLAFKDATVLLVPHVYGVGAWSESDTFACERIFEEVQGDYPGRIGVLRGEYSPNEVRYLIGRCGFFVGSRMHACIAAVSQCIPAVSIAYSDKFVGVMRPTGLEALVADARTCTTAELLDIVQRNFERRAELTKQLESRIPRIREQVLKLMDTVPALTTNSKLVPIAS